MNTLDFILVIVLLLGLYSGWRNGFVSQSLRLVSLCVILFFGFEIAEIIQTWLIGQHIVNPEWVVLVSYIAMLILIAIGVGILSSVLSKFLKTIGLGIFNRIFGAGLGLLKNYLIGVVIVFVFIVINDTVNIVSDEWIKQSLLLPYFEEGVNWISSNWDKAKSFKLQ